MSYFGEMLSRLLAESGMNQAELARASKVQNSQISRWRSGKLKDVSAEHLAALATAISEEPQKQAELIRAHLLDRCVGPGSQLIDISIGGNTLREKGPEYRTKRVRLSPELDQALAELAAMAPENEDLKAMLIQFAAAFKKKR
jgi:transcriptional regulator with XRE-family HTH domain